MATLTFFAVTPISAVEPLLGKPGHVVWIPDGDTGWERIVALPQSLAPLTGFAVVATLFKVLNVAGATELGVTHFQTDGDPWPEPPARQDGETLAAYVNRLADSEAAA